MDQREQSRQGDSVYARYLRAKDEITDGFDVAEAGRTVKSGTDVFYLRSRASLPIPSPTPPESVEELVAQWSRERTEEAVKKLVQEVYDPIVGSMGLFGRLRSGNGTEEDLNDALDRWREFRRRIDAVAAYRVQDCGPDAIRREIAWQKARLAAALEFYERARRESDVAKGAGLPYGPARYAAKQARRLYQNWREHALQAAAALGSDEAFLPEEPGGAAPIEE